ncbi:MAG: flagellar hook protein FlgE [Pseudomonadota bacterium]
MALSSALFSGISGLSTLGSAMQIIGDNIANVNTVGFKGSSFTFQDLLSQATSTMSGTAQVGRGTGLGDVSCIFGQGSFESTGNTTDLAIGGQGFFAVRQSESDSLYYTRAGNFRFDKAGYLVNPEGYVVQGWELDPETGEDVGSVTDILLTSFTSPPQETDQIEVIVNLDSDGANNSAGANALSTTWDGEASPPLAESAYEYQSTLKVYDSLGSTHDITVYFDKAETASQYEFIVTCNPSEDQRAPADDSQLGLLARGLVKFNSGSGIITDIDLDLNDGDLTWTPQAEATDLSNGYFTFSSTFISGNPSLIELNLGARYDGASWVSGSLATTQFARASTTTFQSANGYGAGDLQGVDVDVDGGVTGSYSNGVIIPLFRVALAKFTNLNGLKKEGGNLFTETRDSGTAITNKPGTNGLGNIAPNSLEQSNVDIAAEFVKMITTQRGFQANSKIITVTDQMLAELINLKR